MARIPQNTITGIPTMVRNGNTAAPMPNGGLGRAIEVGAAGMNTQIRREQDVSARRVQDIGRKGEAIQGAINSAANFALAVDRAKEERDDAWASKTIADFNNTMGPKSLGFKDESGAFHDGLLSVPFTPGDEDGKGGTSVQSATNDAIVQYQKDNGLDKISGRRKELFESRMKDSIGRWMTKAQSVDAQNIRSYYDGVRKAKTESSFNTAMAFVLPDDSESFGTASAVYASDAAFSIIDSRFISNYAEWVRSPDRDPAKLEFVSPLAKAEYDREYVHALDKVNASRVNALLKMAVDSEDPTATSQIFGFLEDPESPIGFSTAEQRREFESSIEKAKEQRVVVEIRREARAYSEVGDDIIAYELGGKPLDEISAKLPKLSEAHQLLAFDKINKIDTNNEILSFTDLYEAQIGGGVSTGGTAAIQAELELQAQTLNTPGAKRYARHLLNKTFAPQTKTQAAADATFREKCKTILLTGRVPTDGGVRQLSDAEYLDVAKSALSQGGITKAEYFKAAERISSGMSKDERINQSAWGMVERFVGADALDERFSFTPEKGIEKDKSYSGKPFKERSEYISGKQRVGEELVNEIYTAAQTYYKLQKLGKAPESFDAFILKSIRESGKLDEFNSVKVAAQIHLNAKSFSKILENSIYAPVFDAPEATQEGVE